MNSYNDQTNTGASWQRLPALPAQARTTGRRVPDWMVLALTCTGQFMVILDTSIVNVALPSIQTSLGFTGTGLQWVVNAYLLTFGGFLLIGGRTADLFGQRRMLNAGAFTFSAASLICGLAPAPAVLIAARAVQGLGGAMLAPATLRVLTMSFTQARERTKALSTWTAVGAMGGVAGTILGGSVTAAVSWRWIFLINVPLGTALIALAMFTLSRTWQRKDAHIDLAGAICATVGMAALIYGIVQTDPYGWNSGHALGPIGAGLAFMVCFVLIEARLASKPMLPLQLLRSPTMLGGTAVLILMGSISVANWYFSSLFLQRVLGYGPMRAGLAMLPAAALVITATAVSRLMSRISAHVLVVLGCLCHVIGFGWLSRATAASGYVSNLLLPMVLIAAGIGLVFIPTTVAVTSRVTQQDAGIVSGVANACRQVGGSIGLAVLATVASSMRSKTTTGIAATDPHVTALAAGYDRVFLIAAGIAVITALASTALPTRMRTD